ncbi:MAG: hypothetical protein WC728_17890 [Elusimicrobiota bacterium]
MKQYSGEVVYIYAFDIAYEMADTRIGELLGHPAAEFAADISKHGPQELLFYRPEMVRLPPWDRVGPHGSVRIHRTIKVLPMGAISITLRVPFEVDRLEELVGYHDLELSGRRLHDEVRELAEQVRRELTPLCLRPTEQVREEEAYTVFCVGSPIPSTQDWLKTNQRAVAALLTEEKDAEKLSQREVEKVMERSLSYYDRDLTVIDWDAALLVDDPRNFDEVLHIMELANVQLTELEAYDRILDKALERAYRDVAGRRLWGRSDVLDDIREMRIDFARLSDELSNITKFFGDWYLARIYQQLSERFHLADWNQVMDSKLKTLDELYEILKADRDSRWMMLMEATIVLLFIVDLALIFKK